MISVFVHIVFHYYFTLYNNYILIVLNKYTKLYYFIFFYEENAVSKHLNMLFLWPIFLIIPLD